MTTTTITPIAIPAAEFAAGWTNVARAETVDPDDMYYRTMIVEVYENRGVRVIGTNRYLMLWTWLAAARDIDDDSDPEPAPELDEDPDITLWVKDRHHLFHQACKGIARQAKANPHQRIVLSVGVMEDDAQPTLDPDLNHIGLILAAPDQRELAPLLLGVTPPEWRRTLDGFDPKTVDVTAYSIDTLKRIGGLANDMGYVRLVHQGPDKPVLLHADTNPPVDGLMVPVQLHANVPADETDWTDDVIAKINEDAGYQPPTSPEVDAQADRDASQALADLDDEWDDDPDEDGDE